MSAVTERGGTAIEMFFSACFFPYQNEKSRASMLPMASAATGLGVAATAVIRTVQLCMIRSVDLAAP